MSETRCLKALESQDTELEKTLTEQTTDVATLEVMLGIEQANAAGSSELTRNF